MSDYDTALSDICSVWPSMMPPARLRVSESIAQSLVIARPGGATGSWDPSEVPYMIEPADLIGSRDVQAVCFVGPAQSGKTMALCDGVVAHAIANDPGDALVVQMTQDKAREFSTPRMDRMIRHSPALSGLLVRDNIHDKLFRNGMLVKIAWPTPSNLASTSYRYAISTDYDRVDDDIGGEGDLWGMMMARVRTFMTRGKVVAESSPGRPIKDPNWAAQSPHEAPPVGGILGIYNRGDRRRWYWQCPHCREWLEAAPGLGLFGLPPEKQLLEDVRAMDIDAFAAQYARVICPHSGCVIEFEHRKTMNAGGRWLQEGLRLDAEGRVSGVARTSSIASFWAGGVAATYSTWERLIRGYLQGLLSLALEGKEQALQTTVNLDQGMPFLSRRLADAAERSGSPIDRAEDVERYVVPEWTRMVLAFVDVQGGRNARFVVQIHAVGVHGEEQLVDRYSIVRSARPGVGDDFAPIDPASHPEDWDVLDEQVVQATYRTPLEGREIRVYKTMVDSGGEDGVTLNAYRWMRRLRDRGLAGRVRLSKGDGTMSASTDWYYRESYVGLRAGPTGDIALQLLNTNKLKDVVYQCIGRSGGGPGSYHFPKPRHPTRNPSGWLPESFFDELAAEVRGPNGKYTQVKRANEALDACVAIKALQMILGVDRRGFWSSPPPWAAPLHENSELVDAEVRRAEKAARAALPVPASASSPAPPAAGQAPRRVRRSTYLDG
jgi:phage terminase large subunit GpA-like protein